MRAPIEASSPHPTPSLDQPVPAVSPGPENQFEHLFKLKGSDDVGATGLIHEVAAREDQIEGVHGLVFDLDVKHIKPGFRPFYRAYVERILPELELRQTSADGNMHGVLGFKDGTSVARAKKLFRLVREPLLADPNQSWSAKARVPGSLKRKEGQPAFQVSVLLRGRPVKAAEIEARFSGVVPGGLVNQSEHLMLKALVEVLTTPSGQPLLQPGSSRGFCPIHGTGKNPNQCVYDFESARCTCYGDCSQGGSGHVIGLQDILAARVLADPVMFENSSGPERRPRVRNASWVDPGVHAREIGRALASTGDVFVKGNAIYTDEGGRLRPVLAAEDLCGLIGTLTRYEEAGPRRGFEPRIPRKPLVASLMTQTTFKNLLPEILHVSRVPQSDSDGSWSRPGYNSNGVYYEGEAISPASGTEHLDRLFNMFCFARDADRANALGLMIDRLLSHRFAGDRPAGVVKGNQPGIGKSTLARCVATVAGEPFETMTYTPDDEELEKKLGTHVQRSSVITIDNVRSRGTLGSASLERTITAPVYSYRRLGTNSTISGQNDVLFLITLNGGELSPDLTDRSVIIRLVYTGDPGKRPRGDDPAAYCAQHRREIVAELMGMVDRWHGAGRTEVPKDCRFRPWAATVAGVLAANGVQGFLANLGEDHADLTEQDELLATLAEAAPNEKRTASEWVAVLQSQNAEPREWGTKNPRSKATSVGKKLGESVGRVVRVGTDGDRRELVLKSEKDGKSTRYFFEPGDRDTGADAAPATASSRKAAETASPPVPNRGVSAPAGSDEAATPDADPVPDRHPQSGPTPAALPGPEDLDDGVDEPGLSGDHRGLSAVCLDAARAMAHRRHCEGGV